VDQQTLDRRVEILERKMEDLEGLPDLVASLALQISQFQEDVRVEFSALRAEIRAGDEETRREMRELNQGTRTHTGVLIEEVLSRVALLGEHVNGRKPSHRTPERKRSRRSTKG
jgi:hypothetical protein